MPWAARQPMIGSFGGAAYASFAVGSYLAKVAEKVNDANINNKTITITGHLDPGTVVSDQPNGGDSSARRVRRTSGAARGLRRRRLRRLA